MAQVGFENRRKEIVDSSLRKEQKRGEKIPGKNGQRRNFAYLNRLENAIEKYGNKFEQKLWGASTEKLLTKPEDIPEAYWKSQEQILRDNGQGRELSDYEKDVLTDDIRRQQQESLEEWADYLGDEQAPYPMWFKVYAWDGMSKMGVFDKNKAEYKKRDKSTVAPYPHLNQAVLGKVYGAMDDFYHRNTDGGDGEERDQVLDALVQSGSFNKLYSKFLLEQKVIPKTPERTEDVRGEWVEYLPGDEEKLAVAAEGTPWCVASPVVGRNYLEEGTYGVDEDWYDEDEDEVESKAEFILFHLRDLETGKMADNACASIRLGTDGRVVEISGLNDGQALEDSLVPIVEEKVKTLPGGEEFLKAFADKKRLIELDRKMQNGEKLTRDDFEFVFNSDIDTLDTYNDIDPRVDELREYAFSNLAALEEIGIDPVICLKQYMEPHDVDRWFDSLLELGFSVDDVARRMDHFGIANHLDDLLAANMEADYLLLELRGYEIARNYGKLVEAGVDIDTIHRHMRDVNAARIYEDHGDLSGYLRYGPRTRGDNGWIRANFNMLLQEGIDPEALVRRMDEADLAPYRKQVMQLDIAPDVLVEKLPTWMVNEDFETFSERGVSAEVLARKLEDYQVRDHFYELVAMGIDVNELARNLDDNGINWRADELMQMGVDMSVIAPRLRGDALEKHFDEVVAFGESPKDLVHRMGSYGVRKHFDELLELGVDVNELFSEAYYNSDGRGYQFSKEGIERFLAMGVDINLIVGRLDTYGAWEHAEQLAEAGADIKRIANRVGRRILEEGEERLLSWGLSRQDIESLSKYGYVEY